MSRVEIVWSDIISRNSCSFSLTQGTVQWDLRQSCPFEDFNSTLGMIACAPRKAARPGYGTENCAPGADRDTLGAPCSGSKNHSLEERLQNKLVPSNHAGISQCSRTTGRQAVWMLTRADVCQHQLLLLMGTFKPKRIHKSFSWISMKLEFRFFVGILSIFWTGCIKGQALPLAHFHTAEQKWNHDFTVTAFGHF